MDEWKKAALVVIGADWLFNEGRLSMYLINTFTKVLKAHYNCKHREILRESEPNCFECKNSEMCLRDSCFGC